MLRLNNKGFALVETLIVSVFVLSIFTLVYTNFYPLIGEYEKRENYDTVESVYKADVVKRFIENNRIINIISASDSYLIYDRSTSLCTSSKVNNPLSCQYMWDMLHINSIVLCYEYSLENKKDQIKNQVSNNMKDYINTLPDYKTNKYNYKGRIIVEFKETIDAESDQKYDVYKYATLGADLHD